MTSATLKAFKPNAADKTIVVAAHEPQQVVDLLNECNRMFEHGKGPWCAQVGVSAATVQLLSDEELDAPNSTEFGTPVESIRVLLGQATEPMFLRNWS